jgi:tetratricopeptide (TPR) repeat protein
VPPNAAAGSERSALLLAVWLNLSLVMLRLRRWRDVLTYADQVLAREPGSVKALFRRASALLDGLREFDDAERDVNAGLALEPANGELRRLKRFIVQARASERRREAARYSGMFGGPAPPVEPP